MQHSSACPGAGTYYRRFEGLLRVYPQLGYERPDLTSALVIREQTMGLRRQLIDAFLRQFPNQLQEITHWRFSSHLREYKSKRLIAVMMAKCHATKKSGHFWFVDYYGAPRMERNRVTILALLDDQNAAIGELRVFRRMDFPGQSIRLRVENNWLRSGTRLERIDDLLKTVHNLSLHQRDAPV